MPVLRVKQGQENKESETADLVLVNMPFGPGVLEPSLSLSLLKASVQPLGIRTKVLYLTLGLARKIGLDLYLTLATNEPTICGFAGEWIFSAALFGAPVEDGGYIDDILRGASPAQRETQTNFKPLPETLIERIVAVRRQAESFLEECLTKALSLSPRIVGFTSTFQQHAASLALAKRIKERAPGTFIDFGGSNCEGVMGVETLRQFPFVDAVVSGEGDLVFPALVAEVLAGRAVPELPGVNTRHNSGFPALGQPRFSMAPQVQDMDALPYPDYSDFFDQLEPAELGLKSEDFHARVPFESSRGCWWGEKSHCTFCGLNGMNMKFRAKSAPRVLDELHRIHERFPGCGISVADNILDMKYFADLIPELGARKLNLQIFYEVKANLRKDQVRQLRDAGITSIQPGIESFIDEVLNLMRKGVRGLHNIQLLKWCKELGVRPQWNMIWGFPGEPVEEYRRLLPLLPLLTHLPPAGGGGVIRLDRFSPNFNQAEEFGFADVAPYPAYRYIYPLADEAVKNLAYFFTYRYLEPRNVEAYTRDLREALRAWKDEHETSDLFFIDKQEKLLVWDLRNIARQPLTVLSGELRTVYLACDSICSAGRLQKLLEEETGRTPSREALSELLRPLVDGGLLLRSGDSYLSLAIPLGEYSPGPRVASKFQELVHRMGSRVGGGETVVPVPVSPGGVPAPEEHRESIDKTSLPGPRARRLSGPGRERSPEEVRDEQPSV